MNDKQLRSRLIHLAHAKPEFRGKILAALKEAGCEKLPEGGMRDNCEKKVEESKEASSKVAVKPETEDFATWVMNTQGPKSVREVEMFVNNVLHIDTVPMREADPNAVKGPRFKKGDQVEIRAEKHGDAATKAVYEQFDGKIGTVTETDGMDVLVEFKAGAAAVRFPGGQKPRGVGIYKYIEAYVVEGSPMMEMIYMADPSAKPSNDARLEVEVYQGRGRPTETRDSRYYTGSVFKAAMGGNGFYFSAFPQQRTRVDPASEASFLPRSFNPAKGNVLYIGLIGKRPAVWKKQLEEMQEKASEGVTAGSKTAGPNAQRARDLLLASRSLLSMTAGPSHNPELEKQSLVGFLDACQLFAHLALHDQPLTIWIGHARFKLVGPVLPEMASPAATAVMASGRKVAGPTTARARAIWEAAKALMVVASGNSPDQAQAENQAFYNLLTATWLYTVYGLHLRPVAVILDRALVGLDTKYGGVFAKPMLGETF